MAKKKSLFMYGVYAVGAYYIMKALKKAGYYGSESSPYSRFDVLR